MAARELTTGQRRGEVCGVRWPSIDLDRGVQSIRESRVVVDGRAQDGRVKTDDSARQNSLDPETVQALRDWKTPNALPARGDTVVGHDVWLGYRAMVMPGVRIGNGAIIASGSVVVDDVPDYRIVGGNPAELIRRRYTHEDITRLLALA
jgi:acetyltransferase-like isoleucine patch superfamily enzyme